MFLADDSRPSRKSTRRKMDQTPTFHSAVLVLVFPRKSRYDIQRGGSGARFSRLIRIQSRILF